METVYVVCRNCNEPKTIDEMRTDNGKKLGVQNICKDCDNANQKVYRDTHKETINEKARNRRKEYNEEYNEKRRAYMQAHPEIAKKNTEKLKEKDKQKVQCETCGGQ